MCLHTYVPQVLLDEIFNVNLLKVQYFRSMYIMGLIIAMNIWHFLENFDIQELEDFPSGTIQIQTCFCKRIVAYQHMFQQYQYQLFTSTGLHDMPKSTSYTSWHHYRIIFWGISIGPQANTIIRVSLTSMYFHATRKMWKPRDLCI